MQPSAALSLGLQWQRLPSQQAKSLASSRGVLSLTALGTAKDHRFLKLFPPSACPRLSFCHSLPHLDHLSCLLSIETPPKTCVILFSYSPRRLSEQSNMSALTPLPTAAFCAKLWNAIARPHCKAFSTVSLLPDTTPPQDVTEFVQLVLPYHKTALSLSHDR